MNYSCRTNSVDGNTQQIQKSGAGTYMYVDILKDHSSAVNAFDDSSCTGIFEDRSRYVKFFVERAHDEVAVENVMAACVHHSYNE